MIINSFFLIESSKNRIIINLNEELNILLLCFIKGWVLDWNTSLKQHNEIIMISSKLPEILGVSDRIIVMHEGEITAEFDYKEASEENIMKAAVGLHKQAQ